MKLWSNKLFQLQKRVSLLHLTLAHLFLQLLIHSMVVITTTLNRMRISIYLLLSCLDLTYSSYFWTRAMKKKTDNSPITLHLYTRTFRLQKQMQSVGEKSLSHSWDHSFHMLKPLTPTFQLIFTTILSRSMLKSVSSKEMEKATAATCMSHLEHFLE